MVNCFFASGYKRFHKNNLLSDIEGSLYLVYLFFFLIFLRERAQAGEGQRERERENLEQAPGSELSAQRPIWGSNSGMARS